MKKAGGLHNNDTRLGTPVAIARANPLSQDKPEGFSASIVYDAGTESDAARIMGDFSIQAFEDAGQENGTRFWYAHDFMRVLGYETWQSFQSVITKAMGSCAKLDLDPTDAFIQATYTDETGKECKTYKLTRFACLLVTVHGDSKKQEVSQAKAALAAIADRLIGEKIEEQDLGRIETREDLKLAEKLMSGVAQSAGLQGADFGLFKDAGFRGMYNMGLRQLVAHKKLDGSKTLYDFMGLEELAGNLFRVTQTAARIKSKRDTRALIHCFIPRNQLVREVRSMMVKNSGVAPESLPLSDDIGKVRRRMKSADREMKKLDGAKKAKSPKKAALGPNRDKFFPKTKRDCLRPLPLVALLAPSNLRDVVVHEPAR